ncbi:hypothetical protein BDF14DRAFT_1881687 [Spinellus fusiger]|nr:hypothetical protein BDF14DRAFT_1881687 [Spinellus fusiger]
MGLCYVLIVLVALLPETYVLLKDPNCPTLHKEEKSTVLHCFHLETSNWDKIRQQVVRVFKTFQEHYLDKKCINDKNAIDWIDLSNDVERYQPFTVVSQAESTHTLQEAKELANDQLEDMFNELSQQLTKFLTTCDLSSDSSQSSDKTENYVSLEETESSKIY